MPVYDYKCDSCGSYHTKNLSIANRAMPISEPCPSCGEVGNITQQILGAPSVGDGVRLGIRRPDNGMREVLQKIDAGVANSRLKECSNLTRL